MRLSIVTTLYNNSVNLIEFYETITQQASSIGVCSYELIFVDDGSSDDSLKKAINLSKEDENIIVVELSRNFGHHKAVICGLGFATGDLVFLIDSDLDENPVWLSLFFQKMIESRCDVVFGVQKKRNGTLIDEIFGYLFYVSFRYLTGIKQPNNILTVRLMKRVYVEALLQHQERVSNLGALWILTGFTQIPLTVEKKQRSPSAYNFKMKVDLFIDLVTGFSKKPLTFMFYFGLTTSSIAFLFVLWLVFLSYSGAHPPNGYLSIMASLWLIAGILFTFLGIIGLYVANVFIEVKQRPLAIVKGVHKK